MGQNGIWRGWKRAEQILPLLVSNNPFLTQVFYKLELKHSIPEVFCSKWVMLMHNRNMHSHAHETKKMTKNKLHLSYSDWVYQCSSQIVLVLISQMVKFED